PAAWPRRYAIPAPADPRRTATRRGRFADRLPDPPRHAAQEKGCTRVPAHRRTRTRYRQHLCAITSDVHFAPNARPSFPLFRPARPVALPALRATVSRLIATADGRICGVPYCLPIRLHRWLYGEQPDEAPDRSSAIPGAGAAGV